MPLIRVLSAVEQVASYLREELLREHWSGFLPGVDRLAAELGVSRKTVDAALRQLEAEGFLLGQGPRRKRIIAPCGNPPQPALRVAILVGEAADRRLDYVVELLHELVEAGHTVGFSSSTMVELRMDLKRIARMVGKTTADAWVVTAGSRETLEWFCTQPVPAFALFGRRRGLSIAGVGPDKMPACAEVTRALIRAGHRRIVMLCRKLRRLPEPGAVERAFLDDLAAHALPVSAYNLPDWEESIDGFHDCLEELFRVTAPTALIIDEAPFFVAAQQFLAKQGMRVPEDVSLVCTDADPTFAWCKPSIAHIRWDSRPVVRRIVRWASNVSCGKEDRRQTLTPAEFVPGGTIGLVKGDGAGR